MEQIWDERFETVIRDNVKGLSPERSLTPDLDLTALGLSSLGMVQLLMALEHAYGVQVADEHLEFRVFTSLSGLWRVLEESRRSSDTPTQARP
ncbi:phosphopantetheine-binding protein [Streptomyces sp. NBC_00448]|uniref:phosphopantetheine-binding protein n=1 Tax=Streptomyces sp. NBC_00448 TaxID=2903652 RepID=UPI002E1E6648